MGPLPVRPMPLVRTSSPRAVERYKLRPARSQALTKIGAVTVPGAVGGEGIVAS